MATTRLVRGDTWQRAWLIRHSDDSPVDLTGVAARLHVRDADGGLVMSASLADGRLSIADPLAGRIDLIMPSAVTDISPGHYRYDIEVTHPGGVRSTYEQAALIVLADLARDA